ncbi:MAG: hypothetical protein HRU38_20705 [Saccharospirillaceae bacterium]|nr:hypothetical protein [Saccharospirillaceae bacterium]
MDATQQEYYDFAMKMQGNSSTLLANDCHHASVYLGGYVLEAYIKILLINYGEERYFGHVGDNRFFNKFRRIVALHPEITDILQENNTLYPTTLLNGQDGVYEKSSWDVNHRYKVNIWSDADFCQQIQDEIQQIKSALINLRIDGTLS